jgi:hypothetical protein
VATNGQKAAKSFLWLVYITMLAPEETIFRANSAAIEIRGLAESSAVRNNGIRGRARAALSVVGQNGAILFVFPHNERRLILPSFHQEGTIAQSHVASRQPVVTFQ